MSEIRKAKRRVAVSPGESVRITRELQELSPGQLADLARMSQAALTVSEDLDEI
jgi:hypothetical protein